MRSSRLSFVLALAAFSAAACGGGAADTLSTPGGEDASFDASPSDASSEGVLDASLDTTASDAPPDVSDARATDLDAGDAADALREASGGDDASPDAGESPDASDAASVLDGGGCVPASCDDGVPCTIDDCVSGACTHTPAPLGSASSCGTSSYCDPAKGCVALPICADDALCLSKLGGDVCKANVRCNPATAVCAFDVLDKDGDSHAPRVCGGDDCNDANGAIHPGATELCNGVDDDCDGVTDDGATCPALQACQSGACACLPANLCNGSCVDRSSDAQNCGSCGHACGALETCSGGACACAKELCGGVCTDTSSSAANCGGCGATCPAGASCSNRTCVCPAGQTACATGCTNLSTDTSHCGSCDKVCPGGQSCVGGNCQSSCALGTAECDGLPATVCETSIWTSAANCGSCGHACVVTNASTANASCSGGTCAMTCRGENWDVNGSMSDGCEIADSAPAAHTQATASYLGSQGCSDTTLGSFQGWIVSDARAHLNPTIDGFQPLTGSADDWWSVYGSGGLLCADNYGATISTYGGAGAACYELSLWNGSLLMDSTTVGGASSASISNLATGLYADGSTLYFRVRKTCSTAVSEAVHYSVSFHL